MNSRGTLGAEGEEIAANYLIGLGYKIVERNWRSRHKEIDIIAFDGNELVVVEVKSRTGRMVESISDTINRSKIRNLVVAANAYVTKNGIDLDTRFDVIVVLFFNGESEVSHLKSAFTSPQF